MRIARYEHEGAESLGVVTDDRVRPCRLEDLDESPGQRARLRAVPGVERGLPAARLAVVELDTAADPSQHAHRADRRRGPDLVGEARDEQGDSHQSVTTPFT